MANGLKPVEYRRARGANIFIGRVGDPSLNDNGKMSLENVSHTKAQQTKKKSNLDVDVKVLRFGLPCVECIGVLTLCAIEVLFAVGMML